MRHSPLFDPKDNMEFQNEKWNRFIGFQCISVDAVIFHGNKFNAYHS